MKSNEKAVAVQLDKALREEIDAPSKTSDTDWRDKCNLFEEIKDTDRREKRRRLDKALQEKLDSLVLAHGKKGI